MARTNATNFSGGLQFPYATAAADLFKKEDVQVLAQAVDQHDHTTGKGVTVPISTNASLLTNGSFDVWQRGNGPFTGNSAYSSDRWQSLIFGTDALSISRDTANVDTGSRAGAACTFSLGTGGGSTAIGQQYNAGDGFQVAGRVVSASVRVKTATASAVRIGIFTDGTGGTTTYSSFHTGGGAYQTLTVTVTVPTNATTVWLYAGVFAASCTAYLDNAMLVVGSQPADYAPLHPADDLARCLRYYEVLGETPSCLIFSESNAAASGLVRGQMYYKSRKSVTPTLTKVGTWFLSNGSAQPSISAQGLDTAWAQFQATAAGGAYALNQSAGNAMTAEANPLFIPVGLLMMQWAQPDYVICGIALIAAWMVSMDAERTAHLARQLRQFPGLDRLIDRLRSPATSVRTVALRMLRPVLP